MTDAEFRYCEFCRCHTNARLRACCELGQVKDSKRIEPDVIARWVEDAATWLPERNGKYPGDLLDDPGRLVARYAGQTLLLAEEVNRLRELRSAVGRLSQQLGVEQRLVEAMKGSNGAEMLNLAREQQRRIEELMADERKECERANRLARMLSEALEVLERSGDYGDGGIAKLRSILTSEEEPKENLHGSAIEAWRADAETFLRSSDLGTRRLARRLVAVVDELMEEERKAKGYAEAWIAQTLRARMPLPGIARLELVPADALEETSDG